MGRLERDRLTDRIRATRRELRELNASLATAFLPATREQLQTRGAELARRLDALKREAAQYQRPAAESETGPHEEHEVRPPGPGEGSEP